MKPKITILITLREDGKITMQTTSDNHIATLGCLQAAIMLVGKQLTEAPQSDIVIPSMVN